MKLHEKKENLIVSRVSRADWVQLTYSKTRRAKFLMTKDKDIIDTEKPDRPSPLRKKPYEQPTSPSLESPLRYFQQKYGAGA